jgi:probable rRNA maturation factor
MSPPRPEALTIDFSVEAGLEAEWDEPRIAALVGAIVSRELSVGDYVIGLHLVTDESIRVLKREHLGVDAATDVLSFPLQANDGFVIAPDTPKNLGDVVVSYPTAQRQAHEFGHSVERELAYLVAHGVLHILGYDHETDADRGAMREREEEALQPLGFTR